MYTSEFTQKHKDRTLNNLFRQLISKKVNLGLVTL